MIFVQRSVLRQFLEPHHLRLGDVVPPVSYGDGISDAKCVVSGLQMDYRRFQNQAQLACYTNERDAIRAYDAATPITTNLMGTFKDLDYFEWAKEMDVVSWDNYPGMDTPPSFTAMCHDLMRGIGGNKPFMLMEQTPNQQNWFPFCKVKRPGEVRKLSWQAVSHGADTVQFFQMKQSIGGCERFHGAVIAHDGTEQSRVFKETAALGGELDRIGKRIMGSEIRAKVAIMFDWQSYWSLEGCVGPTAGFSYPNEVHRFYRAFWRRNVPVDIIESTTPLDKLKQYDLVVAPALITVLPGRRRNAGILRIRRRQLHNRLHGRHPRRTRPRGAGRLSRQIARPDGRMGGGNRRARAGRDHRSAWRRG